MDEDDARLMQLLNRLEQVQAGLADGDKTAEAEAREILRRIQTKATCGILAHVFRGLILAWDELQEEWDRFA
jgi:hypothetical protein